MRKELNNQERPAIETPPFVVVEVGTETHTRVPEHTKADQTPYPRFSETTAVYIRDLTTNATKQQRREASRRAKGKNGKRIKVKKAEKQMRQLCDEANKRAENDNQ